MADKNILFGVVFAIAIILIIIFGLIPFFVPGTDPNTNYYHPKLVTCINNESIECNSNNDCTWDGMRDFCHPEYVEIPRCDGLSYECRGKYCVSYVPLIK